MVWSYQAWYLEFLKVNQGLRLHMLQTIEALYSDIPFLPIILPS